MPRNAIICAAVLAALTTGTANAQGYRIDWYSINSGGGVVSGGGYVMSSTVGQTAAGIVQNASYIHWVGFWHGTAATPIACATTADAKLQPDGTLVSVAGKVATSAIGDFAGFFYVEEPDRSSGIRVALSPGSVAGLARGSVVNVIGTLGTAANGERQLTGPMVVIVSTQTPLTPLGMPNRSLGGSDLGSPPSGQMGVTGGFGLNNIGLLVKTWGRVSYLPGNVLAIDDGSGVVARIDASTLNTLPPNNSFVAVTGVSSLWQSGGVRGRMLMPRATGDVTAP